MVAPFAGESVAMSRGEEVAESCDASDSCEVAESCDGGSVASSVSGSVVEADSVPHPHRTLNSVVDCSGN